MSPMEIMCKKIKFLLLKKVRKKKIHLVEYCGLEKKEGNQINPFFGLLADP